MYSTEVWNCDHFECGPSLLSAKHSSLMVSALASRLSGLGSSPGWGHCVVFLGKTNYFSVSLHPGVYMGTAEFNSVG